MCGGLGRAVVEGPTEFFKIRQRMWRSGLSGGSVRLGCDDGPQHGPVLGVRRVHGSTAALPRRLAFVYGATCSNLAWLTVWPFDVVKTQRQSGRHPSVSALALLSNAARDGALFRGLLPGLVRSSIANGTSMVVYKKVHAELSRLAGRDDHSNI